MMADKDLNEVINSIDTLSKTISILQENLADISVTSIQMYASLVNVLAYVEVLNNNLVKYIPEWSSEKIDQETALTILRMQEDFKANMK